MSHFSQMMMLMDEKMLVPILAHSHHPQSQKIAGLLLLMMALVVVDRDDEWRWMITEILGAAADGDSYFLSNSQSQTIGVLHLP